MHMGAIQLLFNFISMQTQRRPWPQNVPNPPCTAVALYPTQCIIEEITVCAAAATGTMLRLGKAWYSRCVYVVVFLCACLYVSLCLLCICVCVCVCVCPSDGMIKSFSYLRVLTNTLHVALLLYNSSVSACWETHHKSGPRGAAHPAHLAGGSCRCKHTQERMLGPGISNGLSASGFYAFLHVESNCASVCFSCWWQLCGMTMR